MKGKIFNAQEVQAIIAGNKTMFREVIKPYPILSDDKSYWEFKGVQWAGENSSYAKNFGDNARPEMPDLCPYQIGQKIKPKPKSGSIDLQLRLFGIELLIKKIRVERLADISEEDAIAQRPQYSIIDPFRNATPIDLFKILWNYTHKKPEEKWGANPWVFVYEFEVLDLKK